MCNLLDLIAQCASCEIITTQTARLLSHCTFWLMTNFCAVLGFLGILSPAQSGSMNLAIVLVYPALGYFFFLSNYFLFFAFFVYSFCCLLFETSSTKTDNFLPISLLSRRFVAGYASARVYTRLGGGRKRRNAVFTAVGFNGIIFFIYFIADIILWANDSSAGRVSNFFSLIALWLFLHTPLVFLGAFFAHRRPVGENPTVSIRKERGGGGVEGVG